MGSLGLFFGVTKRNQNYRLQNPRPQPDYGDDVHSGDAKRDGFTVLAKADPDDAGSRPSVPGGATRLHPGPDQSWEE